MADLVRTQMLYMISVTKFLTNHLKRKRGDNKKFHENYYDHEGHLLRILFILTANMGEPWIVDCSLIHVTMIASDK
jgi:hypothetical protein